MLRSSLTGAERQFCVVPADCVPDTEHIRFGAPADRNSAITAKNGDEITMLITFDVQSVKIQGWSLGIRHDPTKLELIEATHKAAELPIQDADLFFPVTSVAAGTPVPGFISAVVLSIFPPPGKVLPVGNNFPVAKARYKVIANLDATPTKLEFVDNLNPLNSPFTKVNLTVDGKTKRPDKVTDGEIRGGVPPQNTPAGANVIPNLGDANVKVTFAQVNTAGDTKSTPQDANPKADDNLIFISKFYDLTTTAVSAGNITVALKYTDAQIPAGRTEAEIDLYRLVNNLWTKVTTGRDAATIEVSGAVQGLSFFALALVKGVTPTCDDWAFYFGTDASVANLAIANNATSFKIGMRNKTNSLAFSLAVKITGTSYTLVDEVIGTGAPNPNVDLVITDNTGTDQTPKVNTASGGPTPSTVGSIARGAALAPFGPDKDFFVFDTNPGVGGPGFFVAYVADKTPQQTQEIPATASGTPCPVNEILLVNYGVAQVKFKRGDCNGDGRLNVTDAVIDARNIFLGVNDPKRLLKFDCQDMLDANDDGRLDATDPIYILNWLFIKSSPNLPEPRACGVDPTADTLDCKQANCQ